MGPSCSGKGVSLPPQSALPPGTHQPRPPPPPLHTSLAAEHSWSGPEQCTQQACTGVGMERQQPPQLPIWGRGAGLAGQPCSLSLLARTSPAALLPETVALSGRQVLECSSKGKGNLRAHISTCSTF